MQAKRVVVSIIIVHYKAKKELFTCLESVSRLEKQIPFEVIVVDNDEENLKQALQKYSFVVYLKNKDNIGFGAANNVGANYARGEYLYFLNPDTVTRHNVVSELVSFLEKHKDAGVVSPLLLGKDQKPYQQGARNLGVLQGLVSLSIINRLFPNNPVSRRYFLSDWDRSSIKEVDVVPGTAFMIKKQLFDQIGGFDERFFLFFEEFDLCKRLKERGYKLYIVPSAKVQHTWGVSTKKRSDISQIFTKSRFYFFRKHYGLFSAMLVHLATSISAMDISLIPILLASLWLNTYRLNELMVFIGDQAWFYLSARDMLLTGTIPLVGIASSHPWLHQGPLWTYMLSFALFLGNFHPLSGAYLTAFLGTVSVFVLYVVSSKMFSPLVGIVAAGLYATSPLVVQNARFAYHTTPIPIFVMLYIFCLYLWLRGKKKYFLFLPLLLAILYNFELATIPFAFLFATLLFFGYIKKTSWFRSVWNRRTIIQSSMLVIIPMIPILLYDSTHNFPQTFGFLLWLLYKPFKPFLQVFGLRPVDLPSDNSFATFVLDFFHHLVFLPHRGFAVVLVLSSLSFLLWSLWQQYKKKKLDTAYVVLFLSFSLIALGLLVSRTPSDAYVVMFFPIIVLIISLFLAEFSTQRVVRVVGLLATVIIMLLNSVTFVQQEFAVDPTKKSITLSERVSAVEKMGEIAGGKSYKIVGTGWLSDFPSYIMNYKYLSWWLGHRVSDSDGAIKLYVTEKPGEILVEKKISNEE